MAATYKGILTNNGKALIANATVNNKINYSHIAIGDGNGSVPEPSETRPNLVNEKARIALNVVEINPNNTNQIVCEAIIPSNVGGFFIRELGLYAGSTMVVNASYPPTYKPLEEEGAAREIVIKLIINIQNAEVIALYMDDSLIYATRDWVNNNYIRRNEIIDNLTTNDSNKPLSAKQGKVLQDTKLEAIDLKNASTSQRGIVQLYDGLDRTTTELALTAKQGKVLNEQMLGVYQSWNDVKGDRFSNTIYYNTSKRPMLVIIGGIDQTRDSVCDVKVGSLTIGLLVSSTKERIHSSICIIVPPSKPYFIGGSFKFDYWSELSG